MTFAATILLLYQSKPLPVRGGVGEGRSTPAMSNTHPSIPSLKGGEV